jgi:hypothetical protein
LYASIALISTGTRSINDLMMRLKHMPKKKRSLWIDGRNCWMMQRTPPVLKGDEGLI